MPNPAFTSPAAGRGFVLAVGFLLCGLLGILYAWSVFVVPLEALLKVTRRETSLVFTLMIIMFSAAMLGGGRLVPALGSRLVSVIGGILLGAGFMVASQASSMPFLYLGYGVLGGLGVGLSYIAITVVCLSWYPDRRGIASGLLAMALPIGTFILGKVAAGPLIERTGVLLTFRYLGIIFLVCIVLLSLALRRPPKNYSPKGWTPPDKNVGDSWGLSLGQALRRRSYQVIWLWALAIQAGGLMLIGHIAPLAQEKGITPELAATAMGIFALANGLGRFIAGFTWDRFGRLSAMTLVPLFMLLGLIGLAALPDLFGFAGLLVSAILVGFGYGGTIPLLATNFMLFGPKHFGVNFGFGTTALVVASLIGPYLGGVIHTETGNYLFAIQAGVVVTVAGIVLGVLSYKLKPGLDAR